MTEHKHFENDKRQSPKTRAYNDAQARTVTSLLDGLLPETPKKKRALTAVSWKPVALTLVYREIHCNHCEHTHCDPNPFLLLHEEHPTRGIRESAKPKEIPRSLENLPIKHRHIPTHSVPFCSECVETLTDFDLRRAFLAQAGQSSPEEELDPVEAEQKLTKILENL